MCISVTMPVVCNVKGAALIIILQRIKGGSAFFWQRPYFGVNVLSGDVMSEVQELDKERLFQNLTRMILTCCWI